MPFSTDRPSRNEQLLAAGLKHTPPRRVISRATLIVIAIEFCASWSQQTVNSSLRTRSAVADSRELLHRLEETE
jgi:hypothetical protein